MGCGLGATDEASLTLEEAMSERQNCYQEGQSGNDERDRDAPEPPPVVVIGDGSKV